MNLAHHPKLRQLARNLQIPDSGDSLRELQDHAIARVRQMLAEWSGIETIEELRFLVADRLSVKLEFLRTNGDIDRIATEYKHFLTRFRKLLHAEFVTGSTEGLLIDNPQPENGGRRYLAIIDARGARSARAFFTAWHELAHLLLCPPQQLLLEGFRRAPLEDEKRKDPLESAVDHVAGLMAFWAPIFSPPLQQFAAGSLKFEAIERAAELVAPGASLYAASLAGIRLWPESVVFLTAEMGTKSDGTAHALRLHTVIPNERTKKTDCQLRRNMRVPALSVLSHAFNDPLGREWTDDEDQSTWEVSGHGSLPSAGWRVQAVRRGTAVYGLLISTNVTRSFNRN